MFHAPAFAALSLAQSAFKHRAVVASEKQAHIVALVEIYRKNILTVLKDR